MELARFSFLVLQFCGSWRPVHWLGRKAWLYNCYALVLLTIFYSMTLTQVMALITYLTDLQDFINEGLIVFATLIGCIKCTNVLIKRNELVALNEWLQKSPCSPEDEHEIAIQNEYNESIDWIASTYGVVVLVGVTVETVRSFFVDIPNHELPFPAFLFYKIDSKFLYWMTFIGLHISDAMGGAMHVAYESLIAACMLQACAQIKFFQHRMEVMCFNARGKSGKDFDEGKVIKKCLEHYVSIVQFAVTTNDLFTYSIFLQYSISTIIICACMYNLTNVAFMSSQFMQITSYAVCMLVQIFIVCYYGTRITHESSNMDNSIYSLDWTALSISGQKSLIVMMAQARRPIVFTSGHVVVLSLESFTSFCKLSYSAFNLLIQRT